MTALAHNIVHAAQTVMERYLAETGTFPSSWRVVPPGDGGWRIEVTPTPGLGGRGRDETRRMSDDQPRTK